LERDPENLEVVKRQQLKEQPVIHRVVLEIFLSDSPINGLLMISLFLWCLVTGVFTIVKTHQPVDTPEDKESFEEARTGEPPAVKKRPKTAGSPATTV
jgi:hypothetical protein